MTLADALCVNRKRGGGKALARIDRQVNEIDPASRRGQVLLAVRNFRASWIALGRSLCDIAYDGDFKEWGYEDFEVYCARELGLKKPTVKKLMLSYNYLKSREPARLEAAEETGAALPDYQTVELLDRARKSDAVSEEEAERLHAAAFSGEEPEEDLRKQARESLRLAPLPGMEDEREFQRLLGYARRVRSMAAQCRKVLEGLQQRINQTLVELEAL